MTEVTTARKDRTDRSTGERITGPIHLANVHDLMWCGAKVKGIATWNRHDRIESVTCQRCLKAHAADRPQAWKRR